MFELHFMYTFKKNKLQNKGGCFLLMGSSRLVMTDAANDP